MLPIALFISQTITYENIATWRDHFTDPASPLVVARVGFESCISTTSGGCLCFTALDDILIKQCSFSECSAPTGGAISITNSYATVITRCSFLHCTATEDCSDIYMEDISQSFLYCTTSSFSSSARGTLRCESNTSLCNTSHSTITEAILLVYVGNITQHYTCIDTATVAAGRVFVYGMANSTSSNTIVLNVTYSDAGLIQAHSSTLLMLYWVMLRCSDNPLLGSCVQSRISIADSVIEHFHDSSFASIGLIRSGVSHFAMNIDCCEYTHQGGVLPWLIYIPLVLIYLLIAG